jgi:hypothetical protein
MILTSLPLAQGPKPRSVKPPYEQVCAEPCEITGVQLQRLINNALSDPGVQNTKQILQNSGYYILVDSTIGWRQDAVVYPDSTQPAATMIILSFGINNDPTRAAFISWGFSEGDTGYSAAEFYWGEECPLPNFEEVQEDTWLRGVTSSGEGYNSLMPAQPFWKCWLSAFAAGCTACLLRCIASDGGYFHCAAICCGIMAAGTGVGCFVSFILK